MTTQPPRKRIAPTLIAALPTPQPQQSQQPQRPEGGDVTDGTAAAPAAGATWMPEDALKDPFACSANDAIRLRLVERAADIDDGDDSGGGSFFRPTFTHQVVAEDQVVHGYRGLRVDVWHSAASLRAYVASRWDAVAPPPLLRDADPAQAVARRMPRHTPPVASVAEFARVVAEDERGAFTPPGSVVCGGCDGDGGDRWEVRFADISLAGGDAAAREYHERAQIFVLWLIDGGSFIDTADERGWRVFFLFRRSADGKRCALLGYTTAFLFWLYPDQIRLRISQFLIFPPYQRQGHGLRLIEAVYRFAKDPANKIADVTVEDPDEEFRPLRDLADLRALRDAGFFAAPSEGGVMAKAVAEAARSQLKISRQQLFKCHNVFEFERARAQGPEALRLFRLRLKAQIAVLFSDWLQDCHDPDDRKRVLHEIYSEHERDFTELLLALARVR